VNVTTVPEATVNKNGQTFAPKDKVGVSRYGLVTPPAFDAVCPKDGNQTQLGVLVAL
jgi:hypothetical protein